MSLAPTTKENGSLECKYQSIKGCLWVMLEQSTNTLKVKFSATLDYLVAGNGTLQSFTFAAVMIIPWFVLLLFHNQNI